MKLTLTPAILAVVCVIAGCTSTVETTATVHPVPAPMLSPLMGPFGDVLTLPVVKSGPVGKGVVWTRRTAA